MESTLQALGQLLLKAIPTIILLIIVHFYLKAMFFRPMAAVLAKRREATEGLREAAEEMRAKAEEQTKSIETQLNEAREAIYQEQEEARRRWSGEQSGQLEQARHKARELIHQAKRELEAESAAAQSRLQTYAETLADQVATSILERTSA